MPHLGHVTIASTITHRRPAPTGVRTVRPVPRPHGRRFWRRNAD
jgi:hypothetical protein